MLLALALGGCALFECRPSTVIVASKEERSRLEPITRGMRTTETGRLEEDKVLMFVREYWVRTQDGRWLPVSTAEFEAARVGSSIEVCR